VSALGRRNHKNGKGQCDRCGFIYKLNQLRYEWTNLRVCRECWDPLPAQDFPRPLRAESTGLVDPRPRNNTPASTGTVIGQYQIFGRNWNGTLLQLDTGKVTRA
jgi:hypothetical protein